MIQYLSFLAGGIAGAFYYRERRERAALERLGAASLETLLDAIDANNAETGAHVRRVAFDFVYRLIKRVGFCLVRAALSEEFLPRIKSPGFAPQKPDRR